MSLLTIGRLARRCGISRAAVLHYEALGLLSATARSAAGYRYYDEAALARLRQIRRWREAGLDMDAIRTLLAEAGSSLAVLERRLADINRDIAALREQQRMIVRMLDAGGGLPHSRAMTKERWIALLAAAGLDDAAMGRWHALFEADAPEAHQDFLASLGIAADEIAAIRAQSRQTPTSCAPSRTRRAR